MCQACDNIRAKHYDAPVWWPGDDKSWNDLLDEAGLKED